MDPEPQKSDAIHFNTSGEVISSNGMESGKLLEIKRRGGGTWVDTVDAVPMAIKCQGADYLNFGFRHPKNAELSHKLLKKYEENNRCAVN